MPDENTISVEVGSTLVYGYLTQFVGFPGDTFNAGGLSVPVASVDSTSQITLAYGWPGASMADSAAWSLQRTSDAWSSNVQIHKSVATLVQRFEGGIPMTPANAAGNAGGRALYDDAPEGFVYAEASAAPGSTIYVSMKLSDLSGDWSAKQPMKPDPAQSTVESEAARDVALQAAADAESTLDGVQAAATNQGLVYDTLAQLNANLAPGDKAVAQVIANGANNGLYVKVGASGTGSWSKKSSATVPGLDSRVGGVESALPAVLSAQIALSEVRAYPLDANSLDLVDGLIDTSGKLGRGLTREGGDWLGHRYDAPMSANNNLGLVDAVVDASGGVIHGFRPDGARIAAWGWETPLSKENNLGLASACVDENGRVAFGVLLDGTFYAPGFTPSGDARRPSLIVRSGDIHMVDGDVARQLTTTGDNEAPKWDGDGKVRFVSTQRRGVPLEYVVDPVTLDRQLYFPDAAAHFQFLFIGQSLMQGGANVAVTTTPPYPSDALCFTAGPVGSGTNDVTMPLLPLRERTYETISTSFARQLLDHVSLGRKLLITGQAVGGASYADMRKGGSMDTYQRVIDQVTLADSLNGGSAVHALVAIHGEADGLLANTNYANDLIEWLDDYTADVRAANGQTGGLVFFMSQVSSASGYKADITARDTFVTPFEQLKASQIDKRIFLSGPKYQHTYVDHSHIDAASVSHHGEEMAHVVQVALIEGRDWRPTSPSEVTVSGSDVVIDMHVPYGNLTIDTMLVTNPGNYGFNLRNAGGVTITAVTITGPKQVTVSLSAPPPAGLVLSYAFHNGTGGTSGWNTGARGNLRDQSPFLASYTGRHLYNWCVSFKHSF